KDTRPDRYTQKGQDPSEKLESAENYSQWKFAVDLKFDDDSPLYPSDAFKICYALNHMKGNIFQDMVGWFRAKADTDQATWDNFVAEIESFLGITFLTSEARSKLEAARQRSDESASDLFIRLNQLWHYVQTPTDERIRQFRLALLPSLSHPMAVIDDGKFTDERAFLERVRSIEYHKREIHRHSSLSFRDSQCSSSSRYQNRTQKTAQSRPSYAVSLNTTTLNDGDPPVAVKPPNWSGKWFEPQMNPPKITSAAEQDQLRKDRRCYGCRGSGHMATHSVCPKLVNPKSFSAAAASSPGVSSEQPEN
ncbi:hypothetical protein KEM55_006959, partial [Ascosphaera atra]